MNILITGSTGLIGSSLSHSLVQQKHRILAMVRKKPVFDDQVYWDPTRSILDAGKLEGLDAVIHLAGESITGGRWTKKKKERILESRIRGTRLLSKTLAGLASPPGVFISASATGYYGNRGDELLNESSGPGTGFLPELCRQWEKETEPASTSGIRVVRLRTGIVLSEAGGALDPMLPFFKLGLGGKIGNGRQYMSWIALTDLVGIIEYALRTESLEGPVNAVSPNPVTNRVFAKTLGKILSRPTIFFLPRVAARIVFGEMAEALLLASARVVPLRLTGTSFRFQFTSLERALRHSLPAV